MPWDHFTNEFEHPFINSCITTINPILIGIKMNATNSWKFVHDSEWMLFSKFFRSQKITRDLEKDKYFEIIDKMPQIFTYSTHFIPKPKNWSKKNILQSGFIDYFNETCSLSKEIKVFLSKTRRQKKKIIFIGFGSIKNFSMKNFSDIILELEKNLSLYSFYIIMDKYLGDIYTQYFYKKDNIFILSKPEPFHKLFKYINIVICHGGIGTIFTALKCKTRLIVIPLLFDQFFNAKMVRAKKLGSFVLLNELKRKFEIAFKREFHISATYKSRKIYNEIIKESYSSTQKIFHFIDKI